MELIFGKLSILPPNSFLMPGQVWLLRRGYPDPKQASRAATNLIVNVLGLSSDVAVAVSGVRTVIGTQPAFIMSEINETTRMTEADMDNANPAEGLLVDPQELSSETLLELQPEIFLSQEIVRRMR